VVLSQVRDRLERGERPRRADALFAAADPEAAIRALPPDELFYVLHELGFPEAMDILVHATAEQVQTVLDFSVWERDRVAMDKADDWLAALVEAPVPALGRWAQGIDVELLALLVRRRARIYDLSLEEVPEETEGVLWNTPDGCFTLDLCDEPEQVRVTQRLLDSLYRYSPAMMRRLLVGMRAESDAELEETAFRWRSGRMADLGFADLDQAMAAYQELDPATVVIPAKDVPSTPAGREGRLPADLTRRLEGRTPFARAVAGLPSPDQAAAVKSALVLLANRVLSAHFVTPGDEEAVRAVLEALAATLDLAVEFLARGQAEREVAVVARLELLTLHRLGVSLTGKVRRLARELGRKNPFAPLRPAIDIFEAEDAEVLASLSKRHPRFPRVLESPPATGERPFATLADLATATRAVERAAAALELVLGLGIRPAHLAPEALGGVDPATIDTATLARTVLVARLLGRPQGGPVALPGEAVLKFKENFNSGQQISTEAVEKATKILCESIAAEALGGAHREIAVRWLSGLCPLGPVILADRPASP
jgi:hypothetical protein